MQSLALHAITVMNSASVSENVFTIKFGFWGMKMDPKTVLIWSVKSSATIGCQYFLIGPRGQTAMLRINVRNPDHV